MPDVSSDGDLAVGGARSADNKDRWYVTIDPESGKTRVVDTLHDEAWIREAGAGFGSDAVEFLPDSGLSGFSPSAMGGCTSTPLNAGIRSHDPTQLTPVNGRSRAPIWRPMAIVLHHDDRTAPGNGTCIRRDRRRSPDEDHRHRPARIRASCRPTRRRLDSCTPTAIRRRKCM